MSLATFKKKSITKSLGTKRSGKPPGGFWLPQGPFGHATYSLEQSKQNYGPEGFSLNGPHRNVGGIGKESKFSRNGTPYRGIHPYGSGGTFGRYPTTESVFPVNRVNTQGTQYLYIKQSVLSTFGQLEKKYKWVHNGQFPNYWVQPIYTGLQSDTSSQGVYIYNKTATNSRYIDVNNSSKYEANYKSHGPTNCRTSTATFTYNQMTGNSPYTKELNQPISSSAYAIYRQRSCVNPTGKQKPFPYAVQTGKATSASGTSIRRFSSGCNTSNTYTSPPDWYTNSSSSSSSNSSSSTSQYKGSESGC